MLNVKVLAFRCTIQLNIPSKKKNESLYWPVVRNRRCIKIEGGLLTGPAIFREHTILMPPADATMRDAVGLDHTSKREVHLRRNETLQGLAIPKRPACEFPEGRRRLHNSGTSYTVRWESRIKACAPSKVYRLRYITTRYGSPITR